MWRGQSRRNRQGMKKICIMLVLAAVSTCMWALDVKYISIVNIAAAGLKTHTTLSLLNGHVALHISSGNKELDKQFAEKIQKDYPNFASSADAVNREDRYQMTVKVYRENNDVAIHTTVTNFEQKKIIERTEKVKNVPASVLETLQYKTATIAKNEFDVYLDSAFANTAIITKNEFDVYLDSAFANTGSVVADAQAAPPKEFPLWLKPDIRFEMALWSLPLPLPPPHPLLSIDLSVSPQAVIVDIPLVLGNFYLLGQLQVVSKDGVSFGSRITGGYLLRYNDYFYIPVDFGVAFSGDSTGFAFGTGIMKPWLFLFKDDDGNGLGVYTAVKLNLATGSKNDGLNNTLLISLGLIYRRQYGR